MTEKYATAYELSGRAEKVSEKFDEIETLILEMIELGASNQRLKLGLRHLMGKHTHDRRP